MIFTVIFGGEYALMTGSDLFIVSPETKILGPKLLRLILNLPIRKSASLATLRALRSVLSSPDTSATSFFTATIPLTI